MIKLKLKLSRNFRKQIVEALECEKNSFTFITTNSMEEAETLCQRIGIIIKGELKLTLHVHVHFPKNI